LSSVPANAKEAKENPAASVQRAGKNKRFAFYVFQGSWTAPWPYCQNGFPAGGKLPTLNPKTLSRLHHNTLFLPRNSKSEPLIGYKNFGRRIGIY